MAETFSSSHLNQRSATILAQFNTFAELESLTRYSSENEQKEIVGQMRNELISLAENVQKHRMEAKEPVQVKNVAQWVSDIRNKVPIVQNLEKRLNIMQGLDPVMDGILEKMYEVTDNSNLHALQ